MTLKRLRRFISVEKAQVALSVIMQLVILEAFVLGLFEHLWATSFVAAVALLVIRLPLLFARRERVHIPLEFAFLLTAFVYATLFLGEIKGFYARFWWWDLLLHTIAGIALGFIGFLILYALHRNKRLEMGPGLLASFSFAFGLALGALWEILEFGLDTLFGFNAQNGSLRDTMGDLIVDAAGATITALSAYFYLRFHARGIGIFRHYLQAYFRDSSPAPRKRARSQEKPVRSKPRKRPAR